MTSSTIQVFVSSTWLDLQPEREALEAIAQSLREVKFVGMEYFGSRDETTQRASLDEVDRSHLYIGIIGARYGSGITEDEYRRARERQLPCFIYFKQEPPNAPEQSDEDALKLASLKKELRSRHTVTEFDHHSGLAARVATDLHRWLSDNYFPTRQAINAFHQLSSPPRDFTGRDSELGEIMLALEQGGFSLIGLQGLGGVGKTTLALKLAQRLALRYPDAQFYLDLKGTSQTPLSPTEAMAHIIRAYQPTAKLPEGEDQLSALYRSVLHDQRALLLLDNAVDRNQIEPLIPPESCVLLVTSRQHFTLPGLFARHLDALPAEDAQRLLLKIAPRIDERADMIARLCDYLPLALRLAASTLAERFDLGVADYVRRLENEQQRLKLIDASLNLSYELLTPEMQEHWRLLSIFPDTFDSEAARAVWAIELDAAQDVLSELVKYSVLEWDAASARYHLHDLVRVFADARLSMAERSTGQRHHATHYLSVSFEANKLLIQGGEAFNRGLVLFDLDWPNIQAGQKWSAQHASEDDLAASICNDYPIAGMRLLILRQHPRERIRWIESALAAARQLQHRAGEINHLGSLGDVYWALGETRSALDFYERGVALARETGDRQLEGPLLEGLGWVYLSLGEPQRAIEFYEQSLSFNRESGNRHAEGNTLVGLGNALNAAGDVNHALAAYEQALEVALEVGDLFLEGGALGGLGNAYALLGETQRALECYERQLTIARQIGDRRGEGVALSSIALSLASRSKFSEAVTHAQAALTIFEQLEDSYAARVRELLAELRRQADVNS